MKKTKFQTVGIFPNSKQKNLRKSIILAHKYMTTYFPGLVQ